MEAIVNNRISSATSKIGEGAAELKDAAVARASEFKDAAVQRASEFKDTATKATKDTFEKACCETESFIKEQPYRSVLIAFAAGMLASMLIRR